jgi:23S rRNA pseudouridine1911/1915/1917 synthase
MTRELRTLTVPEGVAGERIDSALTRVLGLSRTAIVKLLEDGDITTSNQAMQKSDRVAAGQLIEVLMPAQKNQDPIPLTPLEGLTVIFMMTISSLSISQSGAQLIQVQDGWDQLLLVR